MSNIKIKIKCTHEHVDRESVLEILKKYSIKCSRVNRVDSKTLLLYCNNSQDVDKLFSPACIGDIKKLKCELVAPPDLVANRSIIVKQLDSFIYSQEVDTIKMELENENSWLNIQNIYKFPKSRTVKITFINQNMVTLALDRGLLMFHLSIPPSLIYREVYVNILICYKCYQWNDHITECCKKDSSYMICSLCSSEDHTFKDCGADSRRCVNCAGSHSTLSVSCPTRKVIAKSLSADKVNSDFKSVASVKPPFPVDTSGTTPVAFSNPVQKSDLIERNIGDRIIKSTMCVILAAIGERDDEEGYQATLSKLLSANDLPSFNTSGVSPSYESIMKMGFDSQTQLNIGSTNLTPFRDGHPGSPSENIIKDPGSHRRVNSPKVITKGNKSSEMNVTRKQINSITSSDSPVAAAVIKFSQNGPCTTDSNNNMIKKLRNSRKAQNK